MIKIYLYSTDPYEAKCKYLIKKHEKVSLKHYDDPKAFFWILKWYARCL